MSDQVVVSRGKLIAVADAIRAKKSTTDSLTLDAMVNAIESIEGGGVGEDPNKVVNDFLMGRIEEVENDELVEIKPNCFDSMEGLKRVRLPNATSCGSYNFRDCSNLESVYLPKVTGSGGTYFCASCDVLTDVDVTSLTQLGQYSFRYCYALEKVDLPSVETIGNQAFVACNSLIALILRKQDALVSLTGGSSLSSSAVAKGTGYIYVPSALIEEYKVATNWTKYSDQFRAIEDFPEITGG